MGMIFPSAMVADIRRAHASGAPITKREIQFPGVYVGEPTTVLAPGPQTYGSFDAPIGCSCCGKVLDEGQSCIRQDYRFRPKDETSRTFSSYFHIQKCQHAGGIR